MRRQFDFGDLVGLFAGQGAGRIIYRMDMAQMRTIRRGRIAIICVHVQPHPLDHHHDERQVDYQKNLPEPGQSRTVHAMTIFPSPGRDNSGAEPPRSGAPRQNFDHTLSIRHALTVMDPPHTILPVPGIDILIAVGKSL
jgi:hypothetical protein